MTKLELLATIRRLRELGEMAPRRPWHTGLPGEDEYTQLITEMRNALPTLCNELERRLVSQIESESNHGEQ